MKQLLLSVALLSSLFPFQYELASRKAETKNIDPEISLKSTLKAVYDLNLLLVEIRIINNSKNPIEFLTYSCTTGYNIVVDNKNITAYENVCSPNRIIPVLLNPRQEFIFPVLLKAKEQLPYYQPIRIGWIFLTKNNTGSPENLMKEMIKSSKYLKNVLWSENPIFFDDSKSKTFEIK
jgi:hypothetical protein